MMKLSATVKIKPDYTCSNCGKVQEGTDTYTEICKSSTELTKFILTMKNSPPRQGIPIGWVSNGTEGINCGCK